MDAVHIRVTETAEGIDRLRREIAAWTDRRRTRDPRRQFHTALASIDDTLGGAAERVAAAFPAAATGTPGEIFDACRRFEGRAALVRRLWSWYATKFDQRDDPAHRRALAAADEVAWSVHAGLVRGALAHGLPVPPSPAPLPFLDPVQAPEATPRDAPPAALRPDSADDLLAVLLARLPVPTVALPAGAAWAPWTLVLLGHEVGHHLEHDLLPGGALRERVRTAVGAAGGDDAASWGGWSHELFADLAGLVTMGAASAAALLPFELGGGPSMLDRGRGPYPAPLVRLTVLSTLADRLGLPPVGAPLGDPPATDRRAAAIRRDLGRVTGVVDALLGPLCGPVGLADLAGFDPAEHHPGGAVDLRAGLLLRGDGAAGESGPRAVLGYAAAGHVARSRLTDPAAVRRLADTTVDVITACAEPGLRDAGPAAAPADSAALAAELAALLLRDEP
ncbi:hypothetical protein AB0J72_50910 [Dactylosporangium sp. NPDC049742]|uniref:hypothetical protein n=1 Tax=Dactylosporangium sp. NPDC049742 TaxID=3154737 RepID=UPI0034352D09